MRRAFYHTAVYHSIICLILLQLSCRQASPKAYSHPEYFDTVFIHAENLDAQDAYRAFAYLDAAFAAFPEAGVKDLCRKYLFKARSGVNGEQQALIYCDSALGLLGPYAGAKEFRREYATVYFLKGNIYQRTGNYIKAFSTYNLGMQIVEQLQDSCLQSAYTFLLAEVSYDQGKYLDAARYGRKGVREMTGCTVDLYQFKFVVNGLNNTGIFYDRAGKVDSALYYYQRCLSYMEQHRTSLSPYVASAPFIATMSAVVYGNMGSSYLQLKDTPTAERLFKKSLLFTARKEVQHSDAQYTWIKLARLYLDQNRMEEAKETIATLRYSLDTLPYPKKELVYYRLQMNYWRKEGKKEPVFAIMPAYFRLQDSLDKVATAITLDAGREYIDFRNEHDLNVMKKERQIRNLTLLLIACFAAAVAFAAFFLWYHWARSRKLNRMIREQNGRLKDTLAALEQSQEQNTRIMSIVAHDLRSPIGAIASVVGALVEEPERSPEDKELFALILETCNNSFELIGDLLQHRYLRDNAGMDRVDLGALLASCVDLLQYKAEEKQLQLDLQVKPVLVQGNLGRLWRVISNLVTNAIKFSPPGKHIFIQLSDEQGVALIVIRDQGIGIPLENQDRIFDMFTLARRSGTRGEPAFGMGLAISKQIIETHGGRIWFESREHEGTTFYVELPLAPLT